MFKTLFVLWIFLSSLSLAAPSADAQSSIIPVSAAIHQIRYQVQQQHLSVLSSKPLQPDIRYLSDTSPQRIVVDLPHAVFPAVHQEIIPINSPIDRIRVSQFENSPPKVRMVLDLSSPLDINIRSQRRGNYYETRIEPVLPTRIQANKPNTPSSGGHLLAIEKKGQNLELRGDAALYPEIRRNKNNSRQYTLTLYDFETNLKGMISGLKSPLLEYVSVNNTAKGVDIQLQLSNNNVEIIPFSEGNRCTLQFLVKASDKNLVQLESLQIDELDRRTTRLKLYGSKAFDYQIYPLENPHRLVIDTMGTELENQALAKALSNSQNIRNIRFIPTQLKEGTDIRMVLDLHDQVKYEYAWRNNYLEILLQGPEQQERAPLVTPGNRRAFIVIDAGHGGNDPGAIGPESKTQEKDVTLAVSKYLERYLMNDRIQVAMTRSEDLEILLQPRVDVANLRNADLFISIHANSMPPGNTHVRGIETYYTTAHSKGLADTIHKYMVKELGTPDRRVRSRGLFVTRRSKMPSVLLEIGFLSSPAEEALLSNPSYQRKIAKAIRDGIQAYLSENPGIQNKY